MSSAVSLQCLTMSLTPLTMILGESQVTEEQMAVVAQQMTEKNVSQEDGGAVLVNFEQLLPGKEGKRLGKALVQ